LVAIDGILKAGAPIGVTELFERYKKGNEESIWTLKDMDASGDIGKLTEQEKWLLKYSQPVKIKVVGVWDTVGSVGLVAGDIPGISRSQFDYLQTGLRIPILNGYHALAIDEHRNDFAPTLWDIHYPKDKNARQPPSRTLSNVEQRWFVGAHANVGGGYAFAGRLVRHRQPRQAERSSVRKGPRRSGNQSCEPVAASSYDQQ
jgi:uncharacterized protein (DUF2235 family)